MVAVEPDREPLAVAQMLVVKTRDHLLDRDTLSFGAEHHRRAVRVVGAHVDDVVAAQLERAHPDVGLDLLQQMTEVNRPVGVDEGAGDEDPARLGHGGSPGGTADCVT